MCPAPEPGINTEPIPEELAEGLKYLQSYTYKCMDNHRTVAELCTVCLADGTLSLKPPLCKGRL